MPVLRYAALVQTTLSRAFPKLDVVLMDPRGVGESAPIDCMGPAFLEKGSPFRMSIGPDDDIEVAVGTLSRFWRNFEHKCRNALGANVLANYHSENVARDLDEVRKALGAPKIHLWASSYATLQASIYAKLFPRNVGAFLLHLPISRGTSNRIEDVKVMIAAHERELDRTLQWCATARRCNLGESISEVRAEYDALRKSLREGVTFAGRPVPPASLTRAMVIWVREGARNEIANALQDARAGDWGRVVRRAQRDPYFEDELSQLAYWQASAVLELLDFGCPARYSVRRAAADIEQALQDHPRTAEVFAPLFASCVGWSTKPKEQRILPKNLKGPAMLLVSGANDPATPVEGGHALLQQMNNDSELFVAEVEGHGALYLDDDVTRKAIAFIANAAESRGH